MICVHPVFGDRIPARYEDHIRGPSSLNVLLASDADAIGRLPRGERLLLTRAARKRVRRRDLGLSSPHFPTLAPSSAREIIRFIVRANLRALEASGSAVPRGHAFLRGGRPA